MVPKAELKSNFTPIKIVVMSRPAIAEKTIDEACIIISIADPGADEAVFAASADCRAVLRLVFDDAAPRQGQTPRGKTLLCDADADAILDFVGQQITISDMPSSAPTIVCQCEMGRSRSAGIAAALSRILNGDDAFFFANYTPNRWVYQTILDRYAQSMNKNALNNTREDA